MTGPRSGTMGGSQPPNNRDPHGQTLPDFVVGITIFLITFIFIVQFVPQLALPFEKQEQSVVVQRISSDLGNHLLAETGTPSKLNETCTLAFFERDGGENCPFNPGESVNAQLGVSPAYTVNVTLRDAPSDDPRSALLCDVNGSIGDCGPNATRLGVGPPVLTDDRSVAIARKRVFARGIKPVIEVAVW